MATLSGTGPRNPNASRSQSNVGAGPTPPPPQPQRQPNSAGANRVGVLSSSPATRSGFSSPRPLGVLGFDPKTNDRGGQSGTVDGAPPRDTTANPAGAGADGRQIPAIGAPLGTQDSDALISQRVADTQGAAATPTLTTAEKAANEAALQNQRKGVLGCLSRSPAGASAGPADSCGSDCETIDCLADIMATLLPSLPDSAKGLLCDSVGEVELDTHKKTANAGGALLRAAKDAESALSIQNPLNALDNALKAINPGLLANCIGAQELLDNVGGKVSQNNNAIISVQAGGSSDRLADAFSKGTEKAAQMANLPKVC